MNAKKDLRKEILQLRDALTVDERQIKSNQIAGQVVDFKEFIEADKILLFASYKSEVDTSEIFKAAKRLNKDIYYPKVKGKEMEFYPVQKQDDLIEGYRGIPEPEESPEKKFVPQTNDKICIIMPGAVFDERGNRIGYGGGFYDKFLQRLESTLENNEAVGKENIYKIAVAFNCQIVETGKIKEELHDRKPNCIVTENKIFCNDSVPS